MEDFFGRVFNEERGKRLQATEAALVAAVLAGDALAVATLRVKWLALRAFTVESLDRPGANAGRDELLTSVRQQFPADFPDRKTAKIAAIGAELERRNAAGFVYEGVTYQLTEASQNRIMALALKAQRVVAGAPGATWDDRFVFIAADNTGVPFTAAEFGPFADTAANAVIARRMNARALKDAVLAAADDAAVAAIDITAGWQV